MRHRPTNAAGAITRRYVHHFSADNPLGQLTVIPALFVVLRTATLSILAIASSPAAAAATGSTPAAIVRSVLVLPDDQVDYGRAKLAFDRIIDPSLNADVISAEIDRLAERATALAGAGASQAARLSALRRVIYESGAWNEGGFPFLTPGAPVDPRTRSFGLENQALDELGKERRGSDRYHPFGSN